MSEFRGVSEEQALQNKIESRGLEEINRRELLNGLAVDVLSALNPSHTHEDIEVKTFLKDDILADSLQTQLDKARNKPEHEKLKGDEDALKIIWFYKENSELTIPDKVIRLGDEKDPESLIEPDEKVLFYVDQNNNRSENDAITFQGEKKKFMKGDIPLQRPDVYLPGIPTLAGKYGYYPKSSFSISGCDNLMIGGKVQRKFRSISEQIHPTNGLKTIVLSGIGKCGILPDAQLTSPISSDPDVPIPKTTDIVLDFPTGDIVQTGGEIAPRSVTCQKYILDAGKISNENPLKGRVRLRLDEFENHTEQELNLKLFDLDGDEDLVEREEEITERIVNNQLGIKELPKGESETKTEEEFAEEFDKNYKPNLEMHRKEKDKSTTIIRGYTVEADPEKFTKFAAEAKAAGWKADGTQVGTIMSVTIEKTSSNQ